MANRKITCKNTECKHYKSGDICDTSITIGRSGKCEFLEKGFIYYFQIVWRSLHRKNYVDEIEIMNNPDLKIGLFYSKSRVSRLTCGSGVGDCVR